MKVLLSLQGPLQSRKERERERRNEYKDMERGTLCIKRCF